MKRINKKSKAEQLFALLLMFAVSIGLLCVTGCGEQSCETPKCGVGEDSGMTAIGCSIPGCGGCLTSGKGCNTACWPQACKISLASYKDEEDENNKGYVVACDTRYYGGGCLGCAQNEKVCYNGCINLKQNNDEVNGFFYGTSDSEEKMIGCANGCGGCVASGGVGAYMIDELESMEEIR